MTKRSLSRPESSGSVRPGQTNREVIASTRSDWMRAVDRFILFWGAVPTVAIPLPLEVKLLGWPAVAETALFAAFGLMCYEWVFTEWQKPPFTCSHLSGKIP